MNVKIISSIWFSGMAEIPGTVSGAVLIETAEGFLKGYLGTVWSLGDDELEDAQKIIAMGGAKLTPAMVRAMFPSETADKEIIS